METVVNKIDKKTVEKTREHFLYQAKYEGVLKYGRFIGTVDYPLVELWPTLPVMLSKENRIPGYFILNQETSGGVRMPLSSLNGTFYKIKEGSPTEIAILGDLKVRDCIKTYLDRLNSALIAFPEKLEEDWGTGEGQKRMFRLSDFRLDLDYFTLISYCAKSWIGLDSLQEITRCLEDDYNTEGLSFSIRMVQIGKAETGLSNWAFRVYFDLKED